jgi:hypothetical protein
MASQKTKNPRAHDEWMENKKKDRPKQTWKLNDNVIRFDPAKEAPSAA